MFCIGANTGVGMKTRTSLVVFGLLAAVVCADVCRGADGVDSPEQQAPPEHAIARLRELGLLITADPQRIDEVTSEAAYFMFAQRKDHQPRSEPFKLPAKGHWLDGRPVFAAKADQEAIRPLFVQLVEQAGYDTVWIYAADVHYGVSSYAKFSLYKLGYRDDQRRAGRQPPVLLGDADYVMRLP
jgi:hypothetical protein